MSMKQEKKYMLLLFTILLSISFLIDNPKQRGVTSCYSPDANGFLKLQVRNDSTRYICPEIKVINGVFSACDTHQIVKYKYFINREVIDSNWLVNPIRLYDYFPKKGDPESETNWFAIEHKSSNSNKEDFVSNAQKAGITYRHHESKKNFVTYTIANPSQKAFSNETKFQYQYDWEENVKGKYESFFTDGSKKFRHKYVLTRFMAFDKKASSLQRQSNCDITLSGVIESYHETGKKKQVVIYNDFYVTEKKLNKKRITVKSQRTGQRKTYYESGKLLCEGSISFKGYEGEVVFYSLKKEIIKTTNYKNGVLDGKIKEFYPGPDGVIKSKGQYKAGVKVGKWEFFDSEGKKSSTIKY